MQSSEPGAACPAGSVANWRELKRQISTARLVTHKAIGSGAGFWRKQTPMQRLPRATAHSCSRPKDEAVLTFALEWRLVSQADRKEKFCRPNSLTLMTVTPCLRRPWAESAGTRTLKARQWSVLEAQNIHASLPIPRTPTDEAPCQRCHRLHKSPHRGLFGALLPRQLRRTNPHPEPCLIGPGPAVWLAPTPQGRHVANCQLPPAIFLTSAVPCLHADGKECQSAGGIWQHDQCCLCPLLSPCRLTLAAEGLNISQSGMPKRC